MNNIDERVTGRGITYHVSQLHPVADDNNEGTENKPFKTISRAAKTAGPGDTVLIHEGVYRERITPERGGEEGRPITYEAYPGEKVTVTGSDVWNAELTELEGQKGVFKGKLNLSIFGDYNPFHIKARNLHGNKTLGQVFIDGKMFTEVDTFEELYKLEGTWLIGPEKDTLYLHSSLSAVELRKSLLEITVRDRNFAPHTRGLGYITVRGITFEHCANQFQDAFWDQKGSPQAGAVGCRGGHHWVIENNVIRFAKAIGIDCGSEGGRDLEGDQPMPLGVGYHLIRNNEITDCGSCGIAGFRHKGTKIIGNEITRCNNLGWTSAEEAGIKVHQFVDGLIEGNFVHDNDCHGIWLDNVWHGSRVTRNLVLNNHDSGIFVELGKGPCLVDNNVIAFTKHGEGIYTHDASGVTVVHNLLYCNSHFGVYMRTVSERPHWIEMGKEDLMVAETSHQRVLNNVFIDNYRGHICLPLESERVVDNYSDYNVFINGTQWQWEGLDFGRFVIGTNGSRIKPDRIIEAFKKALDESGIPEEERPNMRRWVRERGVNLTEWSMVTGNDIHSSVPEIGRVKVENGAVEQGSTNLPINGKYIDFRNPKYLLKMECPPVENVDKDFYGNSMKKDKVVAGPFQNIHEGFNHLVLWKVANKNCF